MNFVYIKILEKMKQLEKYELLGMIGSGCIGKNRVNIGVVF